MKNLSHKLRRAIQKSFIKLKRLSTPPVERSAHERDCIAICKKLIDFRISNDLEIQLTKKNRKYFLRFSLNWKKRELVFTWRFWENNMRLSPRCLRGPKRCSRKNSWKSRTMDCSATNRPPHLTAVSRWGVDSRHRSLVGRSWASVRGIKIPQLEVDEIDDLQTPNG